MAELEKTGVEAVTAFLDVQDIHYELVEHDETMSAAAEAEATGRPATRVAKTVVLQDGDGYVIAAVPASCRLDLHKVRDVLGASRSLRLASEDEMARDFPSLRVGAAPPFGPMLPRAEVLDQRLLDEDRILCAAGDHTHSVMIDPRDVVAITGAHVADICEA